MSSGKFTSMAAVLLLVALVCGTCASGFNLTLECRSPVVIRNEGSNSSYTLRPGKSVPVNESPLLFFFPSVTVTLANKDIRPIKIPGRGFVFGPFGGAEGFELEKMKIMCDGDTYCIKLYGTYEELRDGSLVNDMVGRFCPST